jgi:hypothetical protein
VGVVRGLALGLVGGRFRTLEAAVDVLTAFAAGILGLSGAAPR